MPSGQTVDFDVVPESEKRACPSPAWNCVCAHITGGETTKVIAVNKKVMIAKPKLRIRKIAGTGVTAGTDFTFTLRLLSTWQTFTFDVPAGFCVNVFGIPSGTTVEVTETVPPIVITPVDATRTCPTPMTNRACANVTAGTTVEMRFTNRKQV